MKNLSYLLFLLVFPYIVRAQSKVSWGEEFKLKKGSSDLAIIKADASGVYLEELHMVRVVGFWGSHERKSSILVKMTPALGEIYRKEYDKELKGKDLESFFFIADKLYLFASGYEKKDKATNLYVVELDKTSGNFKGDWQQIYSWDMSEKGSEIQMRITPNSDSSKIVVTSTNTAKTQNNYEILTLDANLRPLGKAFHITNEFDPKTFQVEDFVYTTTGNAILVGRIYEYEEGKKKKDKNLYFKNYNIRIYDPMGKMKNEVVTDIDGKFLVNSKVRQLKNEIVLAAFYSNEKKKKEINGMLVERLDPGTGNVIGTTKKDLTNAMISDVEEDDDDSKSKKKSDDDEEGLASNLVFRNFFVAPDNSLIILAEKYKVRVVENMSSMPTAGGGSLNSMTVREIYTCEDIYISKVSAKGNIDYLEVLPKSQYEEVLLASGISSGMPIFVGYFTGGTNRPFFSGFGCLAEKNTIDIFFNDDDRNADVTHPGKKIKRLTRYSRSTCFEVQLDMMTGKLVRKPLFSNRDIPPAMPRLGVVMSNTLYITGKDDARWGGKSKLAVGKINTL